ncbi:MAG: OmpA family protein [Saprospiraceae bacterium]|nr:OmpA family protein [Saprospiraceae bacterium]MCB9343921.1 OmpA family protein [Lewinellaceae bacterium]
MKQLFSIFCLVFFLLFVQEGALAQAKSGLTFRYNLYNYVNPEPDIKDWADIYDTEGSGIEFAYNRNLKNHLWLVIPGKFGLAKYGPDRRNQMGVNLDALLQLNFFKHSAFINPNISLGAGSTYNFDAEEFDFNVPAALGLNVKILPNLFLNLQSQYRFSIENRPGWHHGAGFVVYFGKVDNDRDKDGIKDSEDECPDVPGVAYLKGCPDRDGDGIGDSEDKCPDEPGEADMMGCPDKDGDGIADMEDDCPEVPGVAALKGCPDTDNDGITDAEDKCPNDAGPASTGGCPDRDGDGVADKDDACPDKPGDSMHKGCPDSDGDKIYDNEDKCPDVPGVAALQGCPEPKEIKETLERAVRMVQFETGKDVLLEDSYYVLDEVVSLMQAHKAYNLTIAGHTDSQGDDKLNQALSEKRAKRCYDYLVEKGVAAGRMSWAGYGETQPKASNDTADGRKENRRVEFDMNVK